MAFNVGKDIIEEIRARCDIVELIGSYVQLKRSGTNSFKGLCPFHQEKTPSFHVDSARQSFHCFGCGKGGDVFRFFMEKENVGFADALHMLAARTGVVIPEQAGLDPREGKKRADARERLYRINAAFADFFHRYLTDHPDSPGAQYLAGRGIPPEVADEFGIGLAPDDWTACLTYGRYLKFSDEELVESGVIRRKEDSGRCFDHFKGRLTFAIENEQGRVVGFSARSLEPKPLNGGKYINTPETPVFKKGNLLYALARARKPMVEKNLAILCEGQLDTIAFHRAGWCCAMAPQGTGFTENQARILKRYCSRVLLAFDADAAGQKAVFRAVELLLPLSMEVKVIRIPGGKDPDELFRNGGAEAVTAAVNSAIPWLDLFCQSIRERYDMSSPTEAGRAAVEVANYLRMVNNRVELDSYVSTAAEALKIREDSLWAELRFVRNMERRREEFQNGSASSMVPAELPSAGQLEPKRTEKAVPAPMITLLTLALNSENAARMISEQLPPEFLCDAEPVAHAINLAVNCAINGEYGELSRQLSDYLLEHPHAGISRLMVEHEECEEFERAVRDSVRELFIGKLREQALELQRRITSAVSSEERFRLLTELQENAAKQKELK